MLDISLDISKTISICEILKNIYSPLQNVFVAISEGNIKRSMYKMCNM